jgi:hypothetical protein
MEEREVRKIAGDDKDNYGEVRAIALLISIGKRNFQRHIQNYISH